MTITQLSYLKHNSICYKYITNSRIYKHLENIYELNLHTKTTLTQNLRDSIQEYKKSNLCLNTIRIKEINELVGINFQTK